MKVTRFHIEASTYCNARCPGCPRNIYGYNVKDWFNQTHLAPKQYESIRNQYQDLDFANFNGGLGDPMMNPHIVELIEITGDCVVQVTTNGSIGSKKIWEQMANLQTHVVFSIDGLEDTNHLYRQDVEWQKIMDRVKWFISSGGKADWKWVPFKHNAHQIDEARELSKQLGFEGFYTDAQGRDDFPALTKEGEVSHWIQPDGRPARSQVYDAKADIELLTKTKKYLPETGIRFEISCEHLKGDIYIMADGTVTPCCYHGTRIADREPVKLDGFKDLRKTWNTDNCDPTCANNCGKLITSF